MNTKQQISKAKMPTLQTKYVKQSGKVFKVVEELTEQEDIQAERQRLEQAIARLQDRLVTRPQQIEQEIQAMIAKRQAQLDELNANE